MNRRRVTATILVLAAMAMSLWLRLLPLQLPSVDESQRSHFTYPDESGRERVYLGGFDSYYWARLARNHLRTGSVCDETPCIDRMRQAPVGAWTRYYESPHVLAIANLHRLVSRFDPTQPLTTSAFTVSLLVGLLAVIPAFAICRSLGGNTGGFIAAIAVGANPVVLLRSANADNDAWNVTLPLFAAWAVTAAVRNDCLLQRLGLGALAALFVVIQAYVWSGWAFTFLVMLAALVAIAALGIGQSLAARTKTREWALASAPLFGFLVGGLGIAHWFDISLSAVVGAVLGPSRFLAARASEATTPAFVLPTAMSGIIELVRPTFVQICDMVGGRPIFFAAGLGVLAGLLPHRSWQRSEAWIFLAGAAAFWLILMLPEPRPSSILALATFAMAIALAPRIRNDHRESVGDVGLLVAVWFLASLLLAFTARRSGLFLATPAALALGAGAGRLRLWVLDITSPHWSRSRRSLAMLLSIAITLPLAGVVRQSHYDASRRLPGMNDAWANALTWIRESTEPNAVVTTTWTTGYWVQYVAERATTSDGGTVATRIPYWISRALLSKSPRESFGILRSLHCASDAPRSQPPGAFGRLLRAGIPQKQAHDAMIAVASRNQTEAGDYLRETGLRGDVVDAVLEATHCEPDPGYLVLSASGLNARSWDSLRTDRGSDEVELAGSTLSRLASGQSVAGFRESYRTTGDGDEEVVVWNIDWSKRENEAPSSSFPTTPK